MIIIRLAVLTACEAKVDRAIKSRDIGEVDLARVEPSSLIIKKD